jgi:Glycosyl transferase family 2
MHLRYGFGVRNAMRNLWRRTFVRLNTQHLHGPRRWYLSDNDVVLILVGRNIMHSAPYFLDYYRSRGVNKFVYLDNGSQDNSIPYFSAQSDAIVARCLLNFRHFQPELRFCAASDFAVGGWRLAVDADELLDYPGSGQMSIPMLIDALASRGFTGLAAQMLEMVPKGSLKAHQHKSFNECVESFRYYSTDNISINDYHCPADPLNFFASYNVISNNEIKIMRGGLRKTMFGEDCLLLKHVIFKDAPRVLPLPHPHFTCGLVLADFTAVLYHYKFAGEFIAKEKSLQQERRLSHNEGYIRLLKFEQTGDVIFDFDGLQKDPTIEKLIHSGFLIN